MVCVEYVLFFKTIHNITPPTYIHTVQQLKNQNNSGSLTERVEFLPEVFFSSVRTPKFIDTLNFVKTNVFLKLFYYTRTACIVVYILNLLTFKTDLIFFILIFFFFF